MSDFIDTKVSVNGLNFFASIKDNTDQLGDQAADRIHEEVRKSFSYMLKEIQDDIIKKRIRAVSTIGDDPKVNIHLAIGFNVSLPGKD